MLGGSVCEMFLHRLRNLRRRDFPVTVRQCKYFVSGRLDRTGLMDIDMAACCTERSLIRAKRRIDHGKIRLCSAYNKMYGSIFLFAEFLNDLCRLRAVRILAVSYGLLHICLQKLM